MRTLCDICESAAAIFFCAADEAALCHSCDHQVHTCNKLASRHVRVRLAAPKAVNHCDICENAPAFFYCEIDGTSLCLQCDMAVHVGGKLTHARYLIFRHQVQFRMNKHVHFEDPPSNSMDYVPTGRELNSNLPRHRNPSSVVASSPPGNENFGVKAIDLNSKPHWLLENNSNSQDHRQFSQRYYEFLDNFRSPDGPIFLKICGESSCNGIPNDYLSILAKKFGAAIVSPEHRYYGKSSPFKTYTTQNLKYLSSKQALFDLAAFRQYYQDTLNQKLNQSNVENPWFVFGVSYAGALSAWFRLKFPHLTCGSLASSGVILAIYNFAEYDRQIGLSAGPECKAALQEITEQVEGRLNSNRTEIKTVFGASELTNDGDFLYFLADAAVPAFQYGKPDELCSPLIEAKKSGQDLVDSYASYVKAIFADNVDSYNQEILKDTTSGRSDRLWWFQVCSEVAYFQVAPANDSIRSSKVNTRYHLDLCKNVFGDGVYPEVDVTNLYYGGTKIAGSKIVFTNGSQDPWRHASKQVSSPGMPSYVINCHNCGHGTDLRGCPQSPLSIEGDAKRCSSPDAVNKVRQQVTELIDLWLSECQDLA